MNRTSIGVLALILLTTSGAGLAAAEPVSASLTLDVPSSYVWRGLTLNNRVVAQPGASIALPLAQGALTAGLWTSFEGRASGTAISQRGFDNAGLAEVDYSLEWGREVPVGQIAFGAVMYTLHGPPDIEQLNSTEAYAKFAASGPFAPSAAVYVDVDAVKGAYAELGVSHGVPVSGVPLTLGAAAGFSAGQAVNEAKPAEYANFLKDGLTHVDLSASLKLGSAGFEVSPVAHLILNADEFTRRTSLDVSDQDRRVKFWMGLSAAWSN